MKKLSLVALVILSVASNAFAADSAVNSKIQNQEKKLWNSNIQKKEQTPDARNVKNAAYDLHIVGNIKTDEQGKWGYYVAVHNQSKTRTIAPNTVEIVFVRKRPGGETLLGTYPVTSELKLSGVAGNNFVIKNELPYCCAMPEHEARVRLKGTSTILATTSMHTGSPRTITIANHKITNGGTQFSVQINQRGSEHRKAIVKATVTRNGKAVELAQHEILIPPGDSRFTLSCGKVKEKEMIKVTAYMKTTCSDDDPQRCYMGESHGSWVRE